ncbi:MAG: hypothetical protein A3F17_04950 [Gammaproteobacteria bacterium RIFCSPHIGHO2_12_FULL_41_15]|nr:MAG: hypothetical protein A3F17_04950 [Gammaproteobacteria bacterium RIFCSPHIGHO2_12_FULL_41_15]
MRERICTGVDVLAASFLWLGGSYGIQVAVESREANINSLLMGSVSAVVLLVGTILWIRVCIGRRTSPETTPLLDRDNSDGSENESSRLPTYE